MKAKTNGIETYYELHGREGAPWLVLSHSLACSLRMWNEQIAAFKDRCRILAYDTRGHGRSGVPAAPYTLDTLADDLRALLDALGVAEAFYCGLSMGGMIGQTFALRHPGRLTRLVLADTGHGQTPETIGQWEERIRLARAQGMGAVLAPTMERWFTAAFRGSPRAKEIAALIAATPVEGYAGCAQAIMKLATTARLPEIRVPVLAIAGEADAAAAGTRYIGEHVPGARLVILPQAAHIANVEQAAAFNRAMGDFLAAAGG